MTKVYFCTNRNLLKDVGDSASASENVHLLRALQLGRGGGVRYFGGDLSFGGNIRFGSAEIADGEITEDPKILYEDLSNPDTNEHILGSKELFDHLRAEMGDEQTDTMFYIHGFNNTFEDALVTTAALKEWFAAGGKPMNWLVFSWPSEGRVLMSYREDREDAEASGPAMRRALLKAGHLMRDMIRKYMIEKQEQSPANGMELCTQRVHLMAHSMGNYALGYALAAMQKEKDRLMRLFDQIILVAADTDTNALEKKRGLGCLEHLGRRISTYYNAWDKVLLTSDFLKGNPARLGVEGPSRPQDLPKKFTQIDCTAVVDREAGDNFFEHHYHCTNKYVRRDIIQVLEGTRDGEIPGRISNEGRNFYELQKST